MQSPRSQRPLPSIAALLALGFATLATAARLTQLAFAPTTAETAHSPANPAPPQASAAADRELAQLYAACPMAGIIDLKTVATSPAKADALVPPYRETAHRVAQPPLEPAVPRIRYPVSVQQRPSDAWPQETLRVAEAPAAAKAVASDESQWLIDPNEWFETGEEPKHDAEPKREPAKAPSEAVPKREAAVPAHPTVPRPEAPTRSEAPDNVLPLPSPAEPAPA